MIKLKHDFSNLLKEAKPQQLSYETPKIMGVLNVTPDSFSDGGLYLDPERAIEKALELESQGADIIDIGAQSSRPGSSEVTLEEEWSRLKPILEKAAPQLQIPISVDTYRYEVMQKALDLGVSIINDISAMNNDPRVPELIACYDASIVLMHMRGTPKNMQQNLHYDNLYEEVSSHLERSVNLALEAGVSSEKIIIDPGVGFGKSVESNFDLINMISDFKKEFSLPVLIGISKKSFIQKSTNLPIDQLGLPMAVFHTICLDRGANILRVHDIIDTKKIVDLYLNFRK